MKEEKTIKAYKGFNSDLTCRGFQYEVGKEYTHEGKVNACDKGFHACANPFDVLNYYSIFTVMRYCTVEQSGEINKEQDKIASSKIKIRAEIGWAGLFNAGIEYLKKNIEPSKMKDGDFNDNGDSAKIGLSDNYAQIGSSGSCAQIGSSGDYAQIGSSGNFAKIKSEGKNAVVMCAGYGSMACGKIGSWLTLAEWKVQDGEWRPVCVKTERIDGERIKADTFYTLINGEFTEVVK